MAKRAKIKKVVKQTESTNPILKELEQQTNHRLNVAKGKEKMTPQERKEGEILQHSWGNLHTNERMRNVADIIAATGANFNDVLSVTSGMSKAELTKLAKDSSMMENETTEPLTFECTLTNDQISTLLPVINQVVCVEAQTIESVREWMECKNTDPIKVRKNHLIAYLMYLLNAENYVCQNWQHVATQRKTFVSVNGKILNQKDLSKALSIYRQKSQTDIINKEIHDVVQRCKSMMQ